MFVVFTIQTFTLDTYRCELLTLRANNLHVKVGEAAGCRQRQFDHALHGDRVAVQVVEQRSVLVVVRHQPQLSPRPVIYTPGTETWIVITVTCVTRTTTQPPDLCVSQ